MNYQIETYPTHLIDVLSLANGRRVTVRPVLPQDAALEQALVRALSPSSRYQRFFAPIRELPADWLRRLTEIWRAVSSRRCCAAPATPACSAW